MSAIQAPIKREVDHTGGRTGYGRKVILFNCNCHSFDDVIHALMVAIRCSPQKAMDHAMTVHTKGKSIVYEGHKERCEAVAEVLKDARLRVTIDN